MAKHIGRMPFNVRTLRPLKGGTITSALWDRVYRKLGKRRYNVSEFFLSEEDSDLLFVRATKEKSSMDWLNYSPARGKPTYKSGFLYYYKSELDKPLIEG